MYIQKTAIKRLAHKYGKRCSPSYIDWINRRVEAIVIMDCGNLRGTKTLNGEDAAASHKMSILPRRKI